jgi:polar amino acid transport system substrate-binding protein
MRRAIAAALALLAANALTLPASAADPAPVAELAPTGRLRVAIAVAPAPSAFWATRDAAGSLRGLTVALGALVATRAGLAIEFVIFPSSGEIVKAADSGLWDLTFVPVDAERRRAVDFAAAYHLLQSTYLVAPGSPVATIAGADRAGFRIAGVADTATFRASAAASPRATHLAVRSVDEAVARMKAGEIDAVALSREAVTGLLPALPGARVLDGGFLDSTTAAAVPRGRPAARAWVAGVIEEAKADGAVRRALDAMGLAGSIVAPAGMPP